MKVQETYENQYSIEVFVASPDVFGVVSRRFLLVYLIELETGVVPDRLRECSRRILGTMSAQR